MRAFIFGCCLLAAFPLQADELVYLAGANDSQWFNDSSRLRCELRHPVPNYGQARFVKTAGERLEFRLLALQPSRHNTLAQISSINPELPGLSSDAPLAQQAVRIGEVPVRLDEPRALQLLYLLENGRYTLFRYQDRRDQRIQDVTVGLASDNYMDALAEFRRCVDHLLPMGFGQLAVTDIQFDMDSEDLNKAAETKLRKLVDYIRYDKDIQGIHLKGYVDPVGDPIYNRDLADFRVLAVRYFLEDLGLPEQLLAPLMIGAADNSKLGHNRRVTVELLH